MSIVDRCVNAFFNLYEEYRMTTETVAAPKLRTDDDVRKEIDDRYSILRDIATVRTVANCAMNVALNGYEGSLIPVYEFRDEHRERLARALAEVAEEIAEEIEDKHGVTIDVGKHMMAAAARRDAASDETTMRVEFRTDDSARRAVAKLLGEDFVTDAAKSPAASAT